MDTGLVLASRADGLVLGDRVHHRVEVGHVLAEDAKLAKGLMVWTGMSLILMPDGVQCGDKEGLFPDGVGQRSQLSSVAVELILGCVDDALQNLQVPWVQMDGHLSRPRRKVR